MWVVVRTKKKSEVKKAKSISLFLERLKVRLPPSVRVRSIPWGPFCLSISSTLPLSVVGCRSCLLLALFWRCWCLFSPLFLARLPGRRNKFGKKRQKCVFSARFWRWFFWCANLSQFLCSWRREKEKGEQNDSYPFPLAHESFGPNRRRSLVRCENILQPPSKLTFHLLFSFWHFYSQAREDLLASQILMP